MSDVTQIRVGKHMTGIIGLKSVLEEAAVRCKGMADDRIGELLLEMLSKCNYIPTNVRDEYVNAFLREYKKHIGESVPESSGQILQIKVLGPGCPQCERLEQEVMAVLSETGVIAELEHVRNPVDIGRYGVMGTPALVIDNKVKIVGSVPPKERIISWIQQAANK